MRKTLFFIACLLFTTPAVTGPLDGIFRITGGFFVTSGNLSGELDVASNIFQLNDTTVYGVAATFLVSELLAPGTYTRTHNLAAGGSLTRTATIPGGKTGAYFVIETNGTTYQLFNAWNVNPAGTDFTSTNISGNIFIGGALNGKRGLADFTIPLPPPGALTTTVTVDGGSPQECSEFGGSTVTASATVIESSGAVLDYIEWYLNGNFINSDTSTAIFIPLGVSTLQAIAFATDGTTTGSDSVAVEIRDTTRPDLQVQFRDDLGAVVTSASLGDYQIHFNVTDICDPSPIATGGTAKSVMNIIEGDIVTINASNDVLLPTTAIEVTATAVDASGNGQAARGVLILQ